MRAAILVLASLAIAARGPASAQDPAAGDVVFKDADVIPMTGEAILRGCSVYVSGGKIAALGRFGDLRFPASALVVDARGRYLIPGLCDAHVHTYFPEEPTLFIANGVTFVRNMWGFPSHLETREEIRRKERLGPEIYTTGPIVDGSPPIWAGSLVLDDPRKADAAVRKMKADGYDAVKVYVGLSPESYFAVLKAAGDAGMPVFGHAPVQVGIRRVIVSGQRSIEHLDGYRWFGQGPGDINEELIGLTVEAGVWNCPTLIVIKRAASSKRDVPGLAYVSAAAKESWTTGYGGFDGWVLAARLLKRLSDAGARIAAGTDTGNPYVVAGFSLHEELALMQDAGMSPYQVLRSATTECALLVGAGGRLGTIEAGKDADLVLLDRDPLEDVRNAEAIAGVMVKGRWLPREELALMLEELRRKAGN